MSAMKKTLFQLGSVLLLTAGFAILHAWFFPLGKVSIVCNPATISAEEICLSTVLQEWKNDCIWIDARRREDWQRDGLPGSILLTTAAVESFDALLEQAFPRLATEQKRVVVYCSDQGCGTSKEIAKRLRDYQIVPEVHALYGGWKALSEAGMVPLKK
jgi:rhodanese-related sulfurtransferase